MTAAKTARNRLLRRRREKQATLSTLAREFGVTKRRIAEILEDTGGDPLWIRRTADLRNATEGDLDREQARIGDRIRADLGRYMSIEDERSSRQTDRILGLPG